MSFLLRISGAIDALNGFIGRSVFWLALTTVLIQFALVVMRYVFGIASVFVQESVIYAHAAMFMLVAAFTLLKGEHVRVDIIYRGASPRYRAWIDILGVLFLLIPFCVVLYIYAWPTVASSWAIREGSRETSGIPAVFLLKTCILIFPILVGLQGLSLLIRAVAVLTGWLDSHLPEKEDAPA